MRISSISLENFRSHKNKTIQFPSDKNFIIFTGKNGIGKTNILEAVYTLSLGKSFRTNTYEDMIHWGEEYARVKGEIEEDQEIEVFYSNSPKKLKLYKKNEVGLSQKKLLGLLPTVLFHPEDLNMLYLSPSYRRKYIDIILSQTDKEYLYSLLKYQRSLRHRNFLLKEIRSKYFETQGKSKLYENLDIWDEKITEYAQSIIEKRINFISSIKENLKINYKKISLEDDEIFINYYCKNPQINSLNLREIIKSELISRREQDIKTTKTSFGPHLDDIIFEINERKISTSASRGEYRTLLLSLKLAEIDYIFEKTNKLPILLLDDVFSELDMERQNDFLNAITLCQVFITTNTFNKKESSLKNQHIINL